MTQFKRYDEPDTNWSDPGSTFGIPDRWTVRYLNGLHITAGHNARKGPDYTEFTVPEGESPWKVYALSPHPTVRDHWQMTLVASGTAESVALAKEAAERAARAWSETKPAFTCDMDKSCEEPVTMLDANGFVYCTKHGLKRRAHKPCRKLTKSELNKLARGEKITKY